LIPVLIPPDRKYKDSFADALEEGLFLAPSLQEDIALVRADFDEFMRQRHDPSRPVVLPDGTEVERLPQTDLWLVREGKFIGLASLRPQLNDTLKKRGGNVGYAVRKSERRKGYGKLILKLALPHLKAMGLQKALITCHDQNKGSIRIIEGAGGVLQDKVEIAGLSIPERRYWITL
jgi:predicted acetyltransferase